MSYTITVSATPNPNALKFIINEQVIQDGNLTFRNQDDADGIPLVQALFALSHIKEVFLNDNYITVTQDGGAEWDKLQDSIQTLILEKLPGHNPAITLRSGQKSAVPERGDIDPKRKRIEQLLDQYIRPYLQMDGGDVQVISLNGNVLGISYQGACGGCPGAAFGTLRAIENVLREQYDPDIIVELARSGGGGGCGCH